MIVFSFTGFSAKQTETLKEAAVMFADLLGMSRLSLTLDIERNRKMDVEGECVSEEECKNPRWFTITLRGKKTDDDMVKTLAHEMVHVKQYARNELSKQFRLTRKGIGIGSKWHGEFWDPKGKEDQYFDSPWEIEAYGREVGLYQRWFARNEK